METLLNLVNGWAEKFTIQLMTIFNLDPNSIQKVTDAFVKRDDTLIQQDTQLSNKVTLFKMIFWGGLVLLGFLLAKLIYNKYQR